MARHDADAGFPIEPPIEPMLAKLATELPAGDGWLFEPKWDGFRAIVFRDRDRFYIQSRDLKPLDRYFPELRARPAAEPARALRGRRRDRDRRPSAGSTSTRCRLRLHPAASRVKKLAAETPASFVAFDLLADDGRDLRARPQAERRAAARAGARATPRGRVHLTPCSRDRAVAAGLVPPLRGRRARRRDRQAREHDLPARQARDDQGQARAHRRLRGGRLPLAQERPGRWSARCCSASTTTPARCTTSA